MKPIPKMDEFNVASLAVSGVGEMTSKVPTTPKAQEPSTPTANATLKPKRGRGRPSKIDATDDPIVVTVMLQLKKSEYRAIRAQVAEEEDREDHKISVTRFISNLVQKQIKKGTPNV